MLKGKAAIVTGSTSGIGLGIARALAQTGCNVMLNGLGDPVEIEQIRNGLAEETGVEVDQLGALVVFLCSDAAASLTGAALPVDGGWTAQ